MFCFSSQSSHRKERGRSKQCPGLTQDFSQSASAINHLEISDAPDRLSNLRHSDSNIKDSVSLLKKADKQKPILRSVEYHYPNCTSLEVQSNVPAGESNVISPGGMEENSDVVGEINYIDEIDENTSEIVPVSTLHAVDDVAAEKSNNCIAQENRKKAAYLKAFFKKDSEGLTELQKNNCLPVRCSPRDLAFPHSVLNNTIRDSNQSSSGNSSSSDGLAPIASPERLTPPESGVCSPVSCPEVFSQEHPDTCHSPRIKYKLLHEGDVQVCYLNHTRTIVSKVLSSKFLRRWETHHIFLGDSFISSKMPTGHAGLPLQYSSLQDVYVIRRWENGNKFCIRLVIPNGSILFQANTSFQRDQWLHSILWMKNMHKYRCILQKSSRPEVILKEIKNLVEFSVNSPVQDESTLSTPINIISRLFEDDEIWRDKCLREEVIVALEPLMENSPPTTDFCSFFSKHCMQHPRSPVVAQVFTAIVTRILKRNVDFGKSPLKRRFVAEYIRALQSQNNGDEAVGDFVRGIHGESSTCPHPRVLPNLVAANLGAIFSHFENRKSLLISNDNETDTADRSQAVRSLDKQLQCYLNVFLAISELEDWRPGLGQLLQPVPLPEEALNHEAFITELIPVVRSIGTDKRCEAHSMVLEVRPGKGGLLDLYCPSSSTYTDSGVLWCQMLITLMKCCCRRKSFISDLVKQVGAVFLMALRDHTVAQDILCLMLEWRLLPTEDLQLQAVTTLQSTDQGRAMYRDLCIRQEHLRELQQKGGPRKLTLPASASDADVARLLSCGCFGNLKCLSLAFTRVTSDCAQHLIKLPALKYLNLWATGFGDAGLIIISEHLDHLKELNLCETPVTDKGISALIAMTSLKKLNLNSTKLSLETLERLKKGLPGLQELDVRYTDAW